MTQQICRHCGSHNTIKFGHILNRQRYACKNCGRQFVVPADTARMTAKGTGTITRLCRKCGSSQVVKFGKLLDRQRYGCKECGYCFAEPADKACREALRRGQEEVDAE